MKKGLVVFLNGTSSAGKTSIAKKMQEVSDDFFFRLSIDDYFGKAPASKFNHESVLLCDSVFTQLHHSIKLYSDLSYNVIVDEIFMDTPRWKGRIEECISLLHNYPVFFIRLDCALKVLEERESKRPDREQGLAREQYPDIHRKWCYDFTIQTDHNDVNECASLILKEVNSRESGDAFTCMYHKFEI